MVLIYNTNLLALYHPTQDSNSAATRVYLPRSLGRSQGGSRNGGHPENLSCKCSSRGPRPRVRSDQRRPGGPPEAERWSIQDGDAGMRRCMCVDSWCPAREECAKGTESIKQRLRCPRGTWYTIVEPISMLDTRSPGSLEACRLNSHLHKAMSASLWQL